MISLVSNVCMQRYTACGQICLFRWKLNAMILKALDVTDYLIGLETAWHAILIDATASIGQATFTYVLSGAGSIDVTAAINEQVFSLTDISCKTLILVTGYIRCVITVWWWVIDLLLTKFVCKQCLALDGISTLSDLSAAVPQVKADFPGDAMIWISNF